MAVAAALVSAALAAAQPGEQSLARAVPADVGVFLELRRADDLLTRLVEPQVWLTLADLAGQPAALPETEVWRRRIEQTVRMSPVEAIRTLFAERVAFVAEDVRNTQDAVVLCRPAANPAALLERWQARPLPGAGRTALYRLPLNVGLGVQDDLLLFGDPSTLGLFDQVVVHLDQPEARALADDAAFQRLLARVPPEPDGVFFARLVQPAARRPVPVGDAPPPAATQTAPVEPAPPRPPPGSRPATRPSPGLPELPPLLRNSANILLALHRQDGLLHISAVGDAQPDIQPPPASVADLVAGLPRETLLAWGTHVDFPALAAAATHLPERHVFRVAYDLHAGAGTIQRMTAALDSPTCIAIGAVLPPSRQVPAPPIPAVAVLVRTRDPDAAVDEWINLFHSTDALYRLLSLKLAAPPRIPPIQPLTVAGLEAEMLDLSGLLSDTPEQTPIGELHLVWTLDDDVLILASHVDWLRQVIAARHGSAPRLSVVLEQSRHPRAAALDTLFAVQSGAVADLGAMWLGYFEKLLPQVLRPEWWRDYQPGGGQARIGIQVRQEPEARRLNVESVTPRSPADGIIRAKDAVVGCNRRRFATSQPVLEFVQGVSERPNPRWIDLLVERDGVTRIKRIPLPFVDPVEVLRRIVGVGRVVQQLLYIDEQPDAAGPRGYLTLELRKTAQPLFQMPEPPEEQPVPASAPAPEPPAPAPSSVPASAPSIPPTPTTPGSQPATPTTVATQPATQPTTAPGPAA